uniref:Phosphatidylethanolamine-binding protein 4 n=1 Tax=Neogobius melanostomus TaxID=47308 RepID=A0A8C6UYU5_9GOBI
MGPWTQFLVLLSMSFFEQFHFEATEEKLSTLDASFCQGGLEVVYPELDVNECLIVPKSFREKISTVWKAPDIFFSAAHKKRLYVLVMVDPDAKSRANPAFAHWQHWLVADVQGASLRKGQIKGTTLTGKCLSSYTHFYCFFFFSAGDCFF